MATRLDAPCCELGEGPSYDSASDTAFWFDIVGRALIEYRFASGPATVHALPRMASVIARIDALKRHLRRTVL